MSHITTTPEQLQAFLQLPVEGPFQMLNLLRFKKEKNEQGLTGIEQYQQYMQAVLPFLQKAQAKVLYNGACQLSLIGPLESEWDKMVLVEYSDKETFMKMAMDPSFPTAMRDAALEDSRLILCS